MEKPERDIDEIRIWVQDELIKLVGLDWLNQKTGISKIKSGAEGVFNVMDLKRMLKDLEQEQKNSTQGQAPLIRTLDKTFSVTDGGIDLVTETASIPILNGKLLWTRTEAIDDPNFPIKKVVGILTINGENYTFESDMNRFSANKTLIEDLHAAAGNKVLFNEKYLAEIRLISKLLSNPQHVSISRKFGFQGDKFVTPSIIISKDQIKKNDEILLQFPSTSLARFLDMGFLEDAEEYRKLVKMFIDNYLKLSSSEITLSILSHAFLAPVHCRFPQLPKPLLWIVGLTGEGKSFLMQIVMNLFGDFPEGVEGRRYSWTSTVNYLSEQGAYFSCAVFFVDDYKDANLAAPGVKAVQALVSNYFDGAGKGTLSRDGRAMIARIIQGFFMTNGEDVAALDAAGIARVSVSDLPENSERNLEAGQELLAIQSQLKKILPRYIQWFLNQDVSKFFKSFERVRGEFVNQIKGAQNDLRISTMAAQSVLGLDLMGSFFVDVGIWGVDEFEKKKMEFKNCIGRRVVRTAGIAKQEQASNVFLNTLKSLIFSREAIIHGVDVTKMNGETEVQRELKVLDVPYAPGKINSQLLEAASEAAGNDPIADGFCGKINGRNIGFIKGNNNTIVYLDPDLAVAAVASFHNKKDARFSFSRSAIEKQLLAGGHLVVSQKTGALTKARWRGMQLWVWQINAASLDLDLGILRAKEPDEAPTEEYDGPMFR